MTTKPWKLNSPVLHLYNYYYYYLLLHILCKSDKNDKWPFHEALEVGTNLETTLHTYYLTLTLDIRRHSLILCIFCLAATYWGSIELTSFHRNKHLSFLTTHRSKFNGANPEPILDDLCLFQLLLFYGGYFLTILHERYFLCPLFSAYIFRCKRNNLCFFHLRSTWCVTLAPHARKTSWMHIEWWNFLISNFSINLCTSFHRFKGTIYVCQWKVVLSIIFNSATVFIRIWMRIDLQGKYEYLQFSLGTFWNFQVVQKRCLWS